MSENKSENYVDESSSPRIVEAPRYGCTLSGAYEAGRCAPSVKRWTPLP